jgi:hypothetical protein
MFLLAPPAVAPPSSIAPLHIVADVSTLSLLPTEVTAAGPRSSQANYTD